MMAYFSTGWIVFYIFAAIWLLGWIVSINETSVGQETRFWKKLGGCVMLLFIWPYIAICMASQGDI